tara:strand:- start:194 stop:400 length:207 start_codon:yes stop_codon:yes gene_type:complete
MTTKQHRGPDYVMIIFIIFLVLKLTNNLTWSWWWIFSPFWIPGVLALSIILIVGVQKLFTTLNKMIDE